MRILNYISLSMKKLFAKLILVSSPSAEFHDRFLYFVEVFVKIAPVAYVLSKIEWWFSENQQFGEFMCTMLVLNTVVGVVFHIRSKTFNYREFIWKNIGMALIVICGYMVLEMLRYTAGDNFAGELFKIMIQTITLLYPGSKILKNLYILSNGKFPPEFIMEKLYNFEKNGDLESFFKSKKESENE